MNDFRRLEVRDFLGRNERCYWWSTRKETRVGAHVRDSSSTCGLPKMERKKEFMWWSCFTWYEKGPYHIWEDEKPEEKKQLPGI